MRVPAKGLPVDSQSREGKCDLREFSSEVTTPS